MKGKKNGWRGTDAPYSMLTGLTLLLIEDQNKNVNYH